MTKRVYHTDPGNTVTGFYITDEADEYVLQIGETDVAPTGNLKTPLTLRSDGAWLGATDDVIKENEEKYLAANPDAVIVPTAEQQALTALAQQIADNDNNTQIYLH
ncbi:hypothetical protein AYR56_05435 [Loigolactobacillus backii]|uniref:Uncharacterized protein n=1 Tax=Loigolactobacillus backii TaxID=375175 RepID=A0A192H555_9LACO|nr:hypothetical protein [Loigolactobacillus backii]ANK63352.1 hypothetical protein AYR53_11570 [Loigolactobacillus backii]ANK69643.1 hypothetical protein AYR56_05435 [Loigolactobacillus backii]